MKRVMRALFVLAAFLVPACDREGPGPDLVTPQIESDEDLGKVPPPPDLYTVGWTNEGPVMIAEVNLQDGHRTDIAALDLNSLGEPWMYGTPFGYAIDLDGTMYAFTCSIDGTPEGSWSQLVRVDIATGALTPIGDAFPVNTAGPDIDACGNLYVTGFTEGPPEADPPVYILWGDTYLRRVDKFTGEVTLVGDTGRADWMDLAFDSQNRLWATVDNKIFELDPQTGAQLREIPILGVPQTDIPGVCPEDWPYMEVMTIAFDERDDLYATAMKGFTSCLDTNGPVLRIEMAGDVAYATLIGYTNRPYNHGGDIMPQHVNIKHVTESGKFVPLRIAMSALAEHLAHGDYVPGATPGHPCGS